MSACIKKKTGVTYTRIIIIDELEAFLEIAEANNSKLVQDLDGRDVKIPGYVLPTEFSGDKVVEFLQQQVDLMKA